MNSKQLPHYIQKAAELNLISVQDGKVVSTNTEAIGTVL